MKNQHRLYEVTATKATRLLENSKSDGRNNSENASEIESKSDRGEGNQAGIAGFGFETNLLISDGPGRQKRRSKWWPGRRTQWAVTYTRFIR